VTPRPSAVAIGVLLAGGALLVGAVLDAQRLRGERAPRTAATTELTRTLGLTDLALFNEARYTRHLAMADLHAPFQDHPLALEHFPTGSLVPPPHAHLD